MNFNSGNGDFSNRDLKSLLDVPKFRAFKLRNIVRSLVTSGSEKSTLFSKELSSSQSSLPNKYRRRTDRFPCEKTIQRRRTAFSWSISITIGKVINGPRNEVNTSDRLDTVRTAEDDSILISSPRSLFLPDREVCASPEETKRSKSVNL